MSTRLLDQPRGGATASPGTRQCVDCVSYGVVTWTKSVNAPRCEMHTRLRRSWQQAKWRAEKAGREFPAYEARVLGAQRLLLTPGQIDEITELLETIATAAHEIGTQRGDATLRAFSDLASSRKRLLDVLGPMRAAMHEPRS